jgi:TetR/AcrR family transcriptional regulator, transcriptional repressor of bet genes
MGVGRPSNTDERRAQIVEAFLRVMAQDGYAGATIAKTGRAAGLTPGLVHYHFANKHEILVAAIERLTARLEDRIQARMGGDSWQRLEGFVEAYVGLGDDADPAAVASWVVVGAEAVREPQVRALYAAALEAAFRRVRKLIGEVLRERGRETQKAGPLAAAVMSMIEGAYLISAGAPGLLPEGFAAPMLRRTLETLIEREPRK